MADEPAVPTVDDLNAPEFFVSFIRGVGLDGPNARLVFVSARADQSTAAMPVKNIVNLRVVMSIPAAIQMVEFLDGWLKKVQLGQIEKPPDQPLQ